MHLADEDDDGDTLIKNPEGVKFDVGMDFVRAALVFGE